MARAIRVGGIGAVLAAVLAVAAGAQARRAAEPRSGPRHSMMPARLFSGMRWRNIGPFRAGRVSAVAGVPGNPAVYYIGLPGGGIFKTTDGGVVWKPIFDAVESVSSIGSLAVAASDPNVIYAGTGDVVTVGGSVNEGDGMYKSTDAGRTWRYIGLTRTHHIVALLVDPHHPNLVLAAALGDLYHPSPERGVYRTTDGGRRWTRVLGSGDTMGAVDIASAYDDPSEVFAVMMRHYAAPPGVKGIGPTPLSVNTIGDTAIYKSTDEGAHWTRISAPPLPMAPGTAPGAFRPPPPGPKRYAANGLPADDMGRTGVAVAPHTGGERVYLICTGREGGFYRSDNGGATWRRMPADRRITGSIYFSDTYVDSRNPDIVYVMQTTIYRSTDGGRVFHAFKGAPDGDDYHELWIDPRNPDRILLGSDQGAAISVDHGHTWTPWYNQPTAQVYHISTDQRFPYWVYATQQDSGAVATRERGDAGEITPLDWFPVGGYEFGSIVPSPLDRSPVRPPILYAGGPGHGVIVYNPITQQKASVAPNLGRASVGGVAYRFVENPPLVFSPEDPHTLYEGTQFVTVTHNGGMNWTNLSPDLTLKPGQAAAHARGALETIAPSPVTAQVIWTGSDNGVVSVTRNGGAGWADVTPPGAPADGDYTAIEASHFDPAEAYAAVDDHTQQGDYRPYIYRTRDYGAHWTAITAGLPQDGLGSFVRVVREDTKRRGLLFAGTETSVYVSFDDGDRWQSLRLNSPTTSYRDLVIHGDDLVAGTYGRGFWVLDDITPLRQARATLAAEAAHLYRPAAAIRVRRDQADGTPLPPEVAHAQNPPPGAILDYTLGAPPRGPVTIQIYDARNRLVRKLSSIAPAPYTDFGARHPTIARWWKKPRRGLPTRIGDNRVSWNLRYPSPPVQAHNYSGGVGAVPHQTTPLPRGPLVLPGTYKVVLTVDGRRYSRPLVVENDPRVGQSPALMAALRAQMALTMATYRGIQAVDRGFRQTATLARQVVALGKLPAAVAPGAQRLLADARRLRGSAGGRGFGGGRGAPSFDGVEGTLVALLNGGQTADMAPTAAQQAAWRQACGQLNSALARLRRLDAGPVVALNRGLVQNGRKPLADPAPPPDPVCQ